MRSKICFGAGSTLWAGNPLYAIIGHFNNIIFLAAPRSPARIL
jgi:hypothetical protein